MNMWSAQIESLTKGRPEVEDVKPPLHPKRQAGLDAGFVAVKKRAAETSELVFGAITKNPGCSAKWIKEETGLSRETVRTHLTLLTHEGRIRVAKIREWYPC